MQLVAPDTFFLRRVLPWSITAATGIVAASMLFRMLWFDEVLTVDLLLKLPFHRIYFAYEIPNNHIVFTLLEKGWFDLGGALGGFPYYFFRIPPLLCAGAAVFLLTKKLIRSCGAAAGALLPAAFTLSAVFALYATAVRGYMLGFLLTTLAMLMAEPLVKTGRVRSYSGYFLLCVLSVGTAPTNLAALTGVALYYLPRAVQRGRAGKCRLAFLFLAPCLALALFYLPILDKFLGCVRLGEGWHSGFSAAFTFYSGALFPFLPLLPLCLAGGIQLWLRRPRRRAHCLCSLAILLLPALAFAFMPVTPFPRVFFPLTAVWLFPLSYALAVGFRAFRRRTWITALYLIQGVFCVIFFPGRTAPVSDFLYGKGGRADDYIAPYYARTDFTPHLLLSFLNQKFLTEGPFHVFATFDADAPSLVFADSIMELPVADALLIDPLNRPKTLHFQDIPGVKYIISGSEADLTRAKKRFGFTKSVPVQRFGMQHLDRIADP